MQTSPPPAELIDIYAPTWENEKSCGIALNKSVSAHITVNVLVVQHSHRKQ